MDDLLLELLRPLDERERLRAKRMARAARLAPDPTMRRRAAMPRRRSGSFSCSRCCRSCRWSCSCAAAVGTFADLGEDALLATINVNRGNILSELGDFRRALDSYTAARNAFDGGQMRSTAAQLDVNIGTLYAAQGHYYQALSTISAACQVFTELGSDLDLAGANLELADVYLALNLDAEVTALAAAAAAIFDREGMVHDAALARLLQARGLSPIEAQGEEFDPTPENIEKRVKRLTLAGGVKVALLGKKTRGEAVVGTMVLHFGNEKSLNDVKTANDGGEIVCWS